AASPSSCPVSVSFFRDCFSVGLWPRQPPHELSGASCNTYASPPCHSNTIRRTPLLPAQRGEGCAVPGMRSARIALGLALHHGVADGADNRHHHGTADTAADHVLDDGADVDALH